MEFVPLFCLYRWWEAIYTLYGIDVVYSTKFTTHHKMENKYRTTANINVLPIEVFQRYEWLTFLQYKLFLWFKYQDNVVYHCCELHVVYDRMIM